MSLYCLHYVTAAQTEWGHVSMAMNSFQVMFHINTNEICILVLCDPVTTGTLLSTTVINRLLIQL